MVMYEILKGSVINLFYFIDHHINIEHVLVWILKIIKFYYLVDIIFKKIL